MLRKQVIGAVEQHPTKAGAAQSIESLMLTLNQQSFRRKAGAETFSELVEDCRSKELPKDNHEKNPRKTNQNRQIPVNRK